MARLALLVKRVAPAVVRIRGWGVQSAARIFDPEAGFTDPPTRTNDLLWSRVVRDYLIGERAAPSELMSWNADATRMPYQMHSDYLRRLNNDLAEGRYQVNGRPVSLADLHMPMFVVGTLRDHVAPWKSTYKINFLADADITYVLTSGGHNAGIVAPPGQEGDKEGS